MRPFVLGIVLLTLSGAATQAACPPLATGPDSAVLAANQQRLFCQHQEIHDSASQRNFEMQIQVNRNAIQQFELQRRFDALPRPIMPVPGI